MPAAKKTTARKTPAKRKTPDHTQEGTKVIVRETKMTPVGSLKPFHKNPRVGDPDAVAKSLHINGMFKPIVVNIGTHTGRPMEILAGNHTWIGARRGLEWDQEMDDGTIKHFTKAPWEDILASFVDVDDNAALKIVLADNKTGDDSSYDESILADIFSQIKNIEGTGYALDEVEDILSGVNEAVAESMKAMEEAEKQARITAREERRKNSFEGRPLGEEGDATPYEDAAEDDDDLDLGDYDEESGVKKQREKGVEEAEEDLKGAFTLKEPDVMNFDGVGRWGVIRLRDDMLATLDDFDWKNLDTWAGSATATDENPDRWWFYNWSVGKTDLMKDLSKVIISFYAHDEYWENWWYYTNRYVTKALNSDIGIIVTPDFSQHDHMKKAEWLWQLYRQRWLGRYFQECGMKIIPNITWADAGVDDFLPDYVLSTLPKGLPLISMQMQTISKETIKDKEKYARFIKGYNTVFSVLKPKAAILYAGPTGKKALQDIDTGETQVIIIPTVNDKLEAIRGKKEKKKTI